MTADDYYAILGVSSEASGPDVRAAYRALMRQYHPDVNASPAAVSRAKAINEAYACLRDASKRASYDRLRKTQSSDQRTVRAPRPSYAPHAARPVWTGPRAEPVGPTFSFQPSWWKAAGLGAATFLTIITFTVTSATPPRDPAAERPPAQVIVRMVPKAGGMNAGATACKNLRGASGSGGQTRC